MSEWGGRRSGAGRPRGSRNPNTKARREASQQIARQFQIDNPDAFPGDAVSLMQCIYRDPNQDLAVRLDAAKAAARFERPALAATLTKDLTPMPSNAAEAEAPDSRPPIEQFLIEFGQKILDDEIVTEDADRTPTRLLS